MILRVMTIRDVNSLVNVVDSVLYGIIASGLLSIQPDVSPL